MRCCSAAYELFYLGGRCLLEFLRPPKDRCIIFEEIMDYTRLILLILVQFLFSQVVSC